MKKHSTLFAALAVSSSLVACGSDSGLTGGDDEPTPDAPPAADAPPGIEVVRVPGGDITGDTRWTANKQYVLEGYVFVTSGTLTIEPGTVVKGLNGSALAITRGAKLDAVGTAEAPIVFTSGESPQMPGDWGGVVLMGQAPINVVGGTNKVEGFPDSFGDKIVYGATTASAAHDCGKLSYARIEYAGFLLSPDNELNGLTLAGCGTSTKVDHVQVHLGQDDGVEVFGGTVNLSHIVISEPDDDGLDWDLGWNGRAQFLIVQQRAGRGDKAIEADSNRNDNELEPRSMPRIWNATFLGSNGTAVDPQGGFHLRRGTGGHIANAIVHKFPKYAVDVDGTSSVNQFGTNLTIEHTYFVKADAVPAIWPENFDVGSNGSQNDGAFDEAAQIGGRPTNKLDVDPQLTGYVPAAGSPVLTGCGTPPAGFDQTATFCGAVGSVDWTTGWTRYGE